MNLSAIYFEDCGEKFKDPKVSPIAKDTFTRSISEVTEAVWWVSTVNFNFRYYNAIKLQYSHWKALDKGLQSFAFNDDQKA